MSCCLGSLPRRNSATRDSSKVNQPAASTGRMYAYGNAARALPGRLSGQNARADGHPVDLTEPVMNHASASVIYFLVATSDVAAGRHQRVKQLQSLGKFDAIARL